jgi:hypothetical protein
VQIFPVPSQIDDRVAYQLARTVEGHVATTLHFEDLHASSFQLGGPQWEAGGSGAPAERNDRLVLHQKEHVVLNVTGNALAAQPPLKLQDLGIGLTAQVADDQA